MSLHGSPDSVDAWRLPEESPAVLLRRAWQAGREPALDDFVATVDDVSPNLLVSLIRVDLTARSGRTDRQRPED